MTQSINVTGWYYQDPFGLWFITHPIEMMTAIFAVFVVLLILNAKTLKDSFKGFKGINRNVWIILLVVFLAGFWLRNAEYRYGAGYDGYFYLNSAKIMLKHNIYAWSCGIGNDERCYLYNEHLAPPGYPYLIYLSYLLFGVHDIQAMMISGFLGSLSIITVFMITYLLFRNERAALYSAIVFAFIPFDIFLSSTGTVRPTSLFFSGLAFLFYLFALRKDSIRLWSLAAVTLSLSIYMRQENYLLIIPMVLVYIFEKKIGLAHLFKLDILGLAKKYWLPLLIFILSQIPVQHWSSYRSTYDIYTIHNFHIVAWSMLTTLFSPVNFIGNIFFYNPVISFLFMLSPLLLITSKHRGNILVMLSWFLAFFIIYSIYFQCPGFPEYFCFEYLRYMQHLHIPLAILSGLVFYEMERGVHIRFLNRMMLPFLLIIALSFLLYTPNISGVKFTLFKDGRMEEGFTSEMIRAINKTPADSVIFISQAIIPKFDYFENDQRVVVDINIYNSNDFTWTKEVLDDNQGKPVYFIDDGACGDYLTGQCNFIRENFRLNEVDSVGSIRIFELK